MPHMNEIPERELIVRLKSGDRSAFDVLYKKYHAALYLNVIKLVRDKEDAMDIVQDVFITLWNKRSALNTEVSPKGFLFVISYNRSLDLLRSKTRQTAAMRDLGDYFALQGADHMNETSSPELYALINQLSPQQKRVLELCKLEEKTYSEASAELGISKYTVNEYLKKAVAFLRMNLLQKTGPG